MVRVFGFVVRFGFDSVWERLLLSALFGLILFVFWRGCCGVRGFVGELWGWCRGYAFLCCSVLLVAVR